MIQRCEDEKHPSFKDYGAVGVQVCDRWRLFENFLEDIGERPSGTTLDRIDGEKGYSKDNCRWATPVEQAANTKQAVLLTFQGETWPIAEWARRTGIRRATIQFRLKQGWSVEKALTLKPGSRGTNHTHFPKSEREAARDHLHLGGGTQRQKRGS